jgi:hypothetical protein
MSYITPYQYYTNGGTAPTDSNWGSYQYISLADAINNFTLMYVGNDKQINNVKRHEIIFHIKQAIKKLSYDALRSIKSLELEVGDNLKFILPSDYVNYVRISINVNGILRPLVENRQTNTATRYLQDASQNILFDINNELQVIDSDLDTYRLTLYTGAGQYNGCYGYCIDDNWYFGYQVGARFGASPDEMSGAPTFRVNNGVIDFSSGVANQVVVLEYISDGMANGVDTDIQIHKFAEEFIYRYVKWALLNQKRGVTIYDRNQAKKEYTAEFANTRIRLSNLHPSRLLMSLRGQNKWLK